MVFVLNKNKKPLNPCSPGKARRLLKNNQAVVHKMYPFTIRLKRLVENPVVKDYTLKFDPGSKTTGIAVVENKEENAKVVFLANLNHRTDIKKNLEQRRNTRRARRNRKTRYRKMRFNRSKPKGWLAPSVMSPIHNIETWTKKLMKSIPIKNIAIETVRFDIQKMENEDISGIEYQQGTLYGFEVKEYLLHKHGHICQYCHGMTKDNILEVEHMHSKANGGSNRLKNLTIACHTCNQEKDSMNLDDWFNVLKTSKKEIDKKCVFYIEKILNEGSCKFYTDAAKVNSSRKKIQQVLFQYDENLVVSTGGRTKFNRTNRKLPKEHYYDALCVGESTPNSFRIAKWLKPLTITATGHGSRQRTNVNASGFPVSYLPRKKMFFGFKTGDIVKAIVPKGKNQGTWIGKVMTRTTGSFDVKPTNNKRKQGIHYKYIQLIQLADGFNYSY